MQHEAGETPRGPSWPSHAGPNEGSRRFVTAALLARKGRYAEASSLLQEALEADECSETEALDLQARIYVQQGLYLDAESCWRRALDIDSSNPVYVRALYRLRRVHQPIEHVYRIAMVVIGLSLLGLLLWQVGFANPASRHRLDVADQSLGAIRNELGVFRSSSLSQDERLATALTKVATDLQKLDNRLFARIESMPTLSGMNASQEAIIGHLSDRLDALEQATLAQFGGAAKERSAIDHRIAAMEETTTQHLADIGKQQAAADTGHSEQFKVVRAMVEPLGERLSGIESAMGRRVDTAESGIRQDLQPLANAADMSNLACSLSELQEELSQLVIAIHELKPSGREDNGKAGDATGDVGGTEEQDVPIND